jgi:hypothetical protein
LVFSSVAKGGDGAPVLNLRDGRSRESEGLTTEAYRVGKPIVRIFVSDKQEITEMLKNRRGDDERKPEEKVEK